MDDDPLSWQCRCIADEVDGAIDGFVVAFDPAQGSFFLKDADEAAGAAAEDFFDGFPDKPTAEKLLDNLDFQRAVQAYLLAIPAVSQVADRNACLTLGPVNQPFRSGSSSSIPEPSG